MDIISAVPRAAIDRGLPLLLVAVCSFQAAGCGAAPPAADSRPRQVAPPPAPAPAGGDAGTEVDVSVETLLDHAAPPILERRNPFRFGSPTGGDWPPGTPGSLADLWGSGPDPAGGDGTDGPGGATVPGGADPEPLDPLDGLRLIGFVESRDDLERVAVLTDGAGGVFYGLVDDVLHGRYRVLAVGATSVEIEDVARGARKTLRLPES